MNTQYRPSVSIGFEKTVMSRIRKLSATSLISNYMLQNG